MKRFVVLLRGVNVGKAKRLAMADFSRGLQALGCTEVSTLLNSGNAVFSASNAQPAGLAEQISNWLREHLQLEVPTVVLSASEIAGAIAEFEQECQRRQLGIDDASRALFAFRMSAATLDIDLLQSLRAENEHVWQGQRAIYCYCPAGIAKSRLAETLLDFRRFPITSRNLKTVLKLQQRL